MKRTSLVSLCILTSLVLAGCAPSQEANLGDTVDLTATPIMTASASATPQATVSASTTPTLKGKTMTQTKTIASIETDKGIIEVELYPDKAPNTVKNFLDKAASGYYKGLKFHRVEDWVIQGGDPLGNGTGGGKMPTELNDVPFVDGSLGVARGGDIQVSNDSQFFICTTDCGWLDKKYTNFGKVTKGMDIAKKIAIGDKILSISSK